MDLQNKPVLIIGAGRSGIAAAEFLIKKGARPVLADESGAEAFGSSLDRLKDIGVKLSLGKWPQISPGDFDLVVASPGVPLWAKPFKEAEKAGIQVIGELELAFRFNRAPVVAVTGTNGKTTTTALTGEIFKMAGYKTFVAGNIGTPFINVAESATPEDMIVLEVSSFQLETSSSFRPKTAAILNLTPDHLDRHGSIDDYLEAKARIFKNQGPGDKAILNYDDIKLRNLGQQLDGEVIFFSRLHNLERGVFVHKDVIYYAGENNSFPIAPAGEVSIPGAHNLENALAAVACGISMGVSAEVLAETLKTFQGVAHRLELVGEINGVQYVNDSKGTNPEASMKALEAYSSPLVLIAGGRNKGSDFSELARKINEKAKSVIVLGECAEELAAAIQGAGEVNVLHAGDLNEAVQYAYNDARPGDIVLMSPACASWDMFDSYEERGDLFRSLVQDLRG